MPTVSATGAPFAAFTRAQAFWVTRDTIAWNPGGGWQEDWLVSLHSDGDGALRLDDAGARGVIGGRAIELTWDPAGLSAAVLVKFPHLAGRAAFKIPADRLSEVATALQGQTLVSARSGDSLIDVTALQIQGVLDGLYTWDGPLGVSFDSGVPTLRVWAPTAQSVRLHLFDGPTAPGETVVAMTNDPASGVWSAAGAADWYGKYYLYEVQVFVRSTGRVETNLVTDPYSVSLSRNSRRSQIIDLAGDVSLRPAGWDALVKPRLDAPEDIVLYELHLRDFSAHDPGVPDDLKGTFLAFTLAGSHGMRHLRALAEAGLTHVHLLPLFDIATVDEDKSQWRQPAGDLASFAPDSEEQQARVAAVADHDAFNWGYDPWHYTAPEGSYATEADGPARIAEFRAMVQALAESGLRVVMDVVYNHTYAAGQDACSVLDKVVPGYYHRLDAGGNVENSSCCPNTASEFNMMEKLLIDSVLTWAVEYKVDGFRFDLMGHHMKRNLVKLRAALDALTLDRDGVDGKSIYLYGEGWNYGEVANDGRGVNAVQRNMAATGIGTFNDRLRDGARGGGAFNGLREQGFLTGLFTAPNAAGQGSADAQKARLLRATDWVRTGLAGGLAGFVFTDCYGRTVAAMHIDYNGQGAGYTADPQEVVNYIEAHDNETLFDALQAKLPVDTPMADRVRVQNLGMSLLAFSQGVPFFHAGVDLLRSKSMDRNSYNSGDWFNKLDFTGEDNNWGAGLPPARDNRTGWPLHRFLLAHPALKPEPEDIQAAAAHFREVLAIRRSSLLFRLRTAAEIADRLQFHNTGLDQIPGLIVMSLADPRAEVDPQHSLIVVLINARPDVIDFRFADCTDPALTLHPVLAASSDPKVHFAAFDARSCTFRVPGRTAAVFWKTSSALAGTRYTSTGGRKSDPCEERPC